MSWNALKNVGAGLLAKAVVHLKHLWLTHRFREQARSHIGSLLFLGAASSSNLYTGLHSQPGSALQRIGKGLALLRLDL